ncbi:DUF4410 domain-containing protein [Desulfopila sp. IMCC35008]|uniref:DUF4410 domain-containing protein n=1 Tax=Desulfopila sp. IMCC35008 TaxID=2653858 RepID=UPI0013D3FC82|nr:DUF4410 domain-containing protein [Desulfopila sp. IMCC35008]
MKRIFLLLAILPFFIVGCAPTPEMIVRDAKLDSLAMDKSLVPLSKFASAKLLPLKIDEKLKVDDAKLAKAKELDQKLDLQLKELLINWPSNSPDHGELIIQPEVVHLRIISTATRMLAGLMAGQSSVGINLHLIDQETGETIATQEITKGTWMRGSEGVTDKNILDYIANISHQYLLANI